MRKWGHGAWWFVAFAVAPALGACGGRDDVATGVSAASSPTWQQRVERAVGPDAGRCVAEGAAGRDGASAALARVQPPTLDEARTLVPVMTACMTTSDLGDVFTVGSGAIAADCTKALFATIDQEGIARLMASVSAPEELERLQACLRDGLSANEPSPSERRAATVPGSAPAPGLAP